MFWNLNAFGAYIVVSREYFWSDTSLKTAVVRVCAAGPLLSHSGSLGATWSP
jgi:hypothetical protein